MGKVKSAQMKKGKASIRINHGMSSTTLYSKWRGMRERCLNPRSNKWNDYGGRGIKICARWDDFRNFYADMGHPPTKNHSIDRIDVNGDYDPNNCRWADALTQANNRRDNVKISWMGQTMNISEWARKVGISPRVLHNRIFSIGWDIEKAMTLSTRDSARITQSKNLKLGPIYNKGKKRNGKNKRRWKQQRWIRENRCSEESPATI